MPKINLKPLLFYFLYASSFMGFRSIAMETGVFVPQFKSMEVVVVDPLAAESITPKRGGK